MQDKVTYVQAQPGWSVVRGSVEEGQLYHEPIIAWALKEGEQPHKDDPSRDFPFVETAPITAEGIDEEAEIFQRPAGNYFIPHFQEFASSEEVLNFIREIEEKEKTEGES